MIKGGYKIVNFNGAALSGSPETLAGIYDQIVDDYDKPVMVSGVSLNGDIMDDAYAGVQEKTGAGTSKYVELTVYGGVITVTDDDEVTFASAKSNTELTTDVANIVSTAVFKNFANTVTSDLNNAADGWYYYGNNSPNAPATGKSFFVLTLTYLTHKCQIAISRNEGVLYTRTCSSEVWLDWKIASNV